MFHRRFTTIFSLTSISAIIIFARLFYLQIYLQSNFFRLGTKNFLRTEHITSPRGNITDQNGKLLATNRPVVKLYWQGTGNRRLSDEQLVIINQLKSLVQLPLEENEIETAERFSRKHILNHDLSIEKLSKILEQIPEHENLRITTTFERMYPCNSIGCHIVGYLGSVQMQPTGKMGLEKVFEEQLKGESGTVEKTINSLGKKLAERNLKNALSGRTITTTINLDLQKLVESIFPNDYAGSFIVMEAKTGALRALLSRPGFDPNMFIHRISQQEWESIQNNQPFINRAFGACYPPASPFKLITFAAAMDLGLIDEETTWDCKGSIFFGGRTHYCNRRAGHGMLTAKQAIAQSCNIPFFELGKQIPIDTLASYAQKFGLGSKTNCVFPEKSGLVPTTNWKLEIKGEPWWPGETISATIGQSYLLVTPIQNARMISAIIEGYFVKPRILSIESVETSPFELNDEIRLILKQCMKKVVTKGTGSQLSLFEDFKIYAKTGTAQLCAILKPNQQLTDRAHAWFVAHITYKNEAPLVLTILLEHAGAARNALAVAKQFLVGYAKLVDSSR